MKKKLLPILILLCSLVGYGSVQFFFDGDNEGPVYQDITVAESVFEDKFYYEQLTE